MHFKHLLLLASIILPAINSIHAWTEQETQEFEAMLASAMLPKIKPGTTLTRQQEISALEEQITEDEKELSKFKKKVDQALREDTHNPRTSKDYETYIFWVTLLRNMKNKLERLKQEEQAEHA